jgi:hypothetical protein
MKKYFLSGLFSMAAAVVFGQIDRSTGLYKTLKQKDSLLFNASFNTCDLAELERLVSDDFEFYHDKGGVMGTKAEFIETHRGGGWNSSDKQE